ncbi:Uma2 family endonuclease [Streptacidiphilus sp. P02-A3a]|uniref:Uma2 family endonuclease n=1 Tax=Streptacidiphilus sp. P02-A3a TaxID=2704468 RepID=UPI0015FA9446|nr:Uma2 family endonuclease [Streptacidiphilus sp. P02-A3a]QMU72675.1 Uma2 family endonuclease [Streptacidiphilus sp. P02-A3a]
MTAEPISEVEQRPVPDWLIPPTDGFTAAEFLKMDGLPPHTELIDGSLVFVSPQRDFHGLTMYVLESGLRRSVPEHLRVRREMSVVVGKRNCPEPDLLVLRAEAIESRLQTSYQADDVVLAVEVVSPSSEERDRERKPQLYAKAGIRYFWRVEVGDDLLPEVYVYELDQATGAYGLVGIHHDQLKLSTPFTIDIDLTEVDHL